ncbi:MAG TPA: hypothetical protein DIW50_16405, partial [Prolixibacteraceae bacterium]|nr:hypothetical protein [Prolixibacteraceae bacterium]
MQQFLKKHKWTLLSIVLGAAAGYAYWYFIGCTSGTCPIQSHWQSSTLFGALLGYLLGGSFKKKEKTEEEK